MIYEVKWTFSATRSYFEEIDFILDNNLEEDKLIINQQKKTIKDVTLLKWMESL